MEYPSLALAILERLQFAPTSGQEQAIVEFARYMEDPSPYSAFLLLGYAGTGKTSILKAITIALQEAGMRIELMASTGRAAKVLGAATGRRANTIHRQIYRSSAATPEEGGGYKRSSYRERNTLFIVDEASMIASGSAEASLFGSGNLLEDLLTYVWESEGNRLLLVGDSAQLPPVGTTLSEALDPKALEQHYGLRIYHYTLTEVIRQSSTSGILEQATYLRSLLEEYRDSPSDSIIPLQLKLSQHHYTDLKVVEPGEAIESIEHAYSKYGAEECLILSPSNKRALEANLGIRRLVYDYEEELVWGERLIVARNNYHYTQQRDRSDFIANGELIDLKRIHSYHKMYGLRFADATIYLPDREQEIEVRLLLSGLTDEQAQRSSAQRQELFDKLAQDYEHISSIVERRRAIRQDPYWGALEVKYGYAVTTHKAQGGQWRCVLIDLGLMSYLPYDKAMIRWLYTALTRATERVYLLNAPESFVV